MQSTWRSWFWNIFVFVGLLILAGLVTGIAASYIDPLSRGGVIGWGLTAALLWLLAIRSLMLGVRADPRKVTMRGLLRTVTIPWDQVTEIKRSQPVSGAGGAAGATTVSIIRKRPGKAVDEVLLDVLGSYNLLRKKPSLADRAADGLELHLTEFKKREGR